MSRAVRHLAFPLFAAALLIALAASAEPPRRHRVWRPRPEPRFRVTLEAPSGRQLRTFRHRGRTFVLGEPGEAYVIRIRNFSAQRVEAVVSVDGRDAVSGEVADFVRHRGYLVPAFGSVRIDGFRQSLARVAAFRFTDPSDSYSSRMGTPGNVGIIGVAFFKERARRVMAPPPIRRRRMPSTAAHRPAPRAPHSRPRESSAQDRSRGNLGTAYGESRLSPVGVVPFERATPSRPIRVITLRYDDEEGLEARGIQVFPRRQREVLLDEPQAFPANGGLRFAPPPP